MVVLGRRPERLGFWWHTRPASETVRETVRLQCAQDWSEYAAVLYLGRQGVTYDVPGRRRDGTRRHKRPFRWVGHVVVVGADLLAGYYDAVHERTLEYLAKLTDPDLDRVVDTNWTPHVTLGVRLVSVLDDDIQHAGQAAFVRGILPV